MAIFKFDEELQPFTSGTVELVSTSTTISSVLQEAFNTYPQLYTYLFDTTGSWTTEASRFVLVYNDEAIVELEDLEHILLAEHDTLELVGVLPAGHDAVSIGAFIVDLAAEYGVISATTWAAAGTVTYAVIGGIVMAGVMIALNMIMGALMGDVEMPDIQSGSLDNSATYTFTGIKNTTAAGTPVQVVYGTHRTGGQVLALFTSSDSSITNGSASDTYLYYQLGLSEGEIAGISDVEVNKLPYTFYQAVFTAPDTNYVRLGASSQLPMYEFNQIANTTTISRKVLYGGMTQAAVTFSNYTPAYGYIGGVFGWGSIPTLVMGMYTPVISWQPDPE